MDNTLYILAAALGGTLFLGQMVLSLLGIGGHHDVDGGALDGHGAMHDGVGHDWDTSWFFSLLSYRTITAALMFFGLTGLAARSANVESWWTLPIALGGGLIAMGVVASFLQGLSRLRDDGTLRIADAIGARGVVYLTIPGNKSGFGKVHVEWQNRTVELRAVTFQGELSTGTNIIVMSVIDTDTVEVVAAPETARIAHV